MAEERNLNDRERREEEVDTQQDACGQDPAAEEAKKDTVPECDGDRLESEIEDLKGQLAVSRADLYNFRQRMDRDRAKSRKTIAEDKIGEFLPVLDNLDRALGVSEDGSAKDVLVGVRMVQRQFLSVLENSGVTPIPAEDCAFDPLLHDAVETEYVDDPQLDGRILCELLRGYQAPDRVLRPAQVRVGKLRPES